MNIFDHNAVGATGALAASLDESDDEQESGLITSDSDFEEAVRQAGFMSNQVSATKYSNNGSALLQG